MKNLIERIKYAIKNWWLRITYKRRSKSKFEGKLRPLELIQPIEWNRYWSDELQYYKPHMVSRISRQSWTIRSKWTGEIPEDPRKAVASGCLSTENLKSFDMGRHGAIQMEVACTLKDGDWPAAWLFANNGAREIDLFEWISQTPDVLHLTNHWGEDYDDGHRMNGQMINMGSKPYLFNIRLEWDDDLRWYINHKLAKVSENIYKNEKMHLLINLAVGGWSELTKPYTASIMKVFNLKYNV